MRYGPKADRDEPNVPHGTTAVGLSAAMRISP